MKAATAAPVWPPLATAKVWCSCTPSAPGSCDEAGSASAYVWAHDEITASLATNPTSRADTASHSPKPAGDRSGDAARDSRRTGFPRPSRGRTSPAPRGPTAAATRRRRWRR